VKIGRPSFALKGQKTKNAAHDQLIAAREPGQILKRLTALSYVVLPVERIAFDMHFKHSLMRLWMRLKLRRSERDTP
jgi:hypothetical protein